MPKGSHLAELNRSRKIDIIGKRFGKLVVLKEDGKKNKKLTYLCKCDCGKLKEKLPGENLRRGKSYSCGCDYYKGYCKSGLNKEEYYENVKKQLFKLRFFDNECWIFTGQLDRKGYGRKSFGQGKENRKEIVSRIAYRIWKHEIPKGLYVLHKCDNPKCFNPDHLFLGTQKDNIKDMMSKNRCSRKFAKLTENQVLEIRKMRSQGSTLMNIAQIYNVTNGNISHICLRHSWRHI